MHLTVAGVQVGDEEEEGEVAKGGRCLPVQNRPQDWVLRPKGDCRGGDHARDGGGDHATGGGHAGHDGVGDYVHDGGGRDGHDGRGGGNGAGPFGLIRGWFSWQGDVDYHFDDIVWL